MTRLAHLRRVVTSITLMALVLPDVAQPQQDEVPAQVKVTAELASVRADPTVSSRALFQVRLGDVLDVLSAAGTSWYRVKVPAKGTGYVAAVQVEPLSSPGPAKSPAAPSTRAPIVPGTSSQPPVAVPSAPGPAVSAPPVAVDHKGISCVVANRFPQIDACFLPDSNVARAQIHFRATSTDPWFAVPMEPAGRCYSGLLPKPMATIREIQYYVDVIDRGFSEVTKPSEAPDGAYRVRVAKGEGDCARGALIAGAVGRTVKPIVVSIVKDAAGRALAEAAVRMLESRAILTGFSLEGVIIATTGAAPAAATASAAGGGGSAGGAAATASGGASMGGAVVGAVLGGAAAVAAGVYVASRTDTTGPETNNAAAPVPVNQWNSWAVPANPAAFQDVQVFVQVFRAGVTVRIRIQGTDGYFDDQSVRTSSSDGTVSLRIPGAPSGVRDTVTVSVPEWGSQFTRTWTYSF